MLGEALKPLLQAYFLLEEQYYKLLDILEERFAVPIYDYFVDPIESRGIPSFLVALLLFLLLAGGSLLLLTASQPVTLQVSVFGKVDATRTIPLDGAVVEVADDSGVLFTQEAKRGRAMFSNVPLAKLTVRAKKNGFKPANGSVDVSVKSVLRLDLACMDASTCAALAAEFEDPGNQEYPGGKPTPDVLIEPTYPVDDGNGTWNFCEGDGCDDDADSDSATGRLLVLVKDTQGNPLDARASVYDAKTNGFIADAEVVQGSGLVPSLSVGRQVYVNVFAPGYSPYFGNDSGVTIRPATNKLTVTLRAGNGGYVGPCVADCNNTGALPPDRVRVHVVAPNGTGIDGAEVSVFVPDRAEVLYTDYTYDGGILLLTVGNGSYFAVAQAPGYITNNSALFQGGQDVFIVLPPISGGGGGCTGSGCPPCTPENCPNPGQNEAQVRVNVTDEANASAAYADVVLQQRTEFGSWAVVDQQSANHQGLAQFAQLPIGAQVKVRATLYEQSGEANATLVQGINPLDVRIARTPFRITAYGYDPLTRRYVPSARFASRVGNKTVGQCDGNGCRLTVVSGEDVTFNVSADGYVGSERTVYLYEGVDSNVTLYLVNSSALADTYVQWDGLFTSQNRPVSGSLKPGHSYLARLQVFSHEADQSGVVLDTQNDDALIAGLDPQGFDVKGSYGDSCYPTAVDFARDRVAWVDSRYNGAASGSVVFNVSLEPDMALDPRTRTKVLSFGYRSYIVRGADYLRNPFDPALSTQPGQSHPSGCPAAMYYRNYTVKSTGTTCNGQACLTLRFAQGSESGGQDFQAENQVLVNRRALIPFFVFYDVEFFSRPGNETRMDFLAPANRIVVFNATTPIKGPSPLGTGLNCEKDSLKARTFGVLNASFGIDLGNLTRCTNYNEQSAGLKYSFKGVAKSRVLEAGRANVSLVISGLNATSAPLVHSAVFDVSGFGVTADQNAIVEAVLGQPENQLSDSGQFQALSTGNCTPSQIISRQCDAGFLNATFRVTALSGASISVRALTDPGISLYDLQPSTPTAVLERGQSIQGVAQFIVPEKTGTVNITITRDAGAQSTSLRRPVALGGAGFTLNGSDPFPPGWDTCNGFIGLRYDPLSNPPFTLGQGCTDLAFRVSPIFPADSILLNVSMPDYGQILTRTSMTDGSEKCYEICDLEANGQVYGCSDLGKTLYNGQQFLLRYNPELRTTCPAAYKVQGNRLARSQVTLEFSFTGDQTSRRNVTLHVLNDESDSSLYFSPVYTFYRSGSGVSSLFYPQLWAVTNLKQLGKRTVVFKQPSNLGLSFEGPGTQVVAIYPAAGAGIQAFDGSDLNTPVFQWGSPTSPIRAVSRYGLALAAEGQAFNLDTPYAQAISLLLTESLSENAFLRTDVAERLSASVPVLSQRTAYWRSNNAVRYCQQTPACLSSYYTLGGCCRDSIEDWQNQTVQVQYTTQSCTFCNNTYNPSCTETSDAHISRYLQCTNQAGAQVYNCDQRCTPRAMWPANVQDYVNQLGLPGTGITLDALSGQKIRYGDVLAGRTCELVVSSLNAFIEFTPGSNSYTYYVPSNPQTRLSDESVSRCQSNGQCPLVIASAADTFVGGTTVTPKCVADSNHDGLWQPSEALALSVHRTSGAFGGSPLNRYFECPAGQIMAVEESRFFQPARQGGVVTYRTIATEADLQRCRNGLCPLVVNPATAPILPNAPRCFFDSNGNGMIDPEIASEINSMNDLDPATPSTFGGGSAFGGSYTCVRGQLAVSNFCLSGCENYCAQPNCDPSILCSASGVKSIPTGQSTRTFVGWLNESPVTSVTIATAHLSRGRPFLPAAWFPDAYLQTEGKPVFAHSYVVSSKLQSGGLDSLSKIVSVAGCGPGGDYPFDDTLAPNQGIYEIRDSNSFGPSDEVWSATASVLELPVKNYLGVRSDVCRKPNWNIKLCELAYPDYSTQFGGCFNSVLKISPSSKRLGVDASVPLLVGLGYGIKNGIGYGISPGGEVFAQLEPGTFADRCEGDHKVHYDYQTLEHWDPLGRSTGQQTFTWRKDLGCHSDCDCQKKSYNLLAFIVQIITLGFVNLNDQGGGGVFAGLEGIGALGGDVAASAAELKSNIIRMTSPGIPCSDSKQMSFGDATAYACKNTLWSVSPR
ncbi:hypothetical protein HYV43_04510 [Candidatus Micrarchaeota archaeon]|nr:hypothetical protein [Candidatus Micrarchaeota archaeon]